MGFLKDIIERKERFGEMASSRDKGLNGVVWITNPKLRTYVQNSEIENEDVAFVVTKTIRYFKKTLGISLSTIEKFHVKKITQDTIQRFKDVFGDFPEGKLELSNKEFTESIWQKYFGSKWVIRPGNMWVEVVQRMMLEVYSTPIEINVQAGSRIPLYELDYLARVQHKQSNAFIGDDYQK